MSYKSILIHVDSGPKSATRLQLAIKLAQASDAHLTGLFTAPLTPVYDDANTPGFDMSAALKDYIESCATRAHDNFMAGMQQSGLTQYEWRREIGDPIGAVCLNAHYHDLVVLGQRDPLLKVDNLPGDFVESVLLGAGRPVLIVPHINIVESMGRHALVAWDGRKEAARALSDALPLLKQAEHTTVLTVETQQNDMQYMEAPGLDIALFLARHGVQVEVRNEIEDQIDAGNLLLSYATDKDVDLIVMGAYGHSRLREIMLGGVTRTILNETMVPVLMSH
jgi:nucleotide-binding universal stress UspA family protein